MSWNSLGATVQANADELARAAQAVPLECPFCLHAPIEAGRTPGTWHCLFSGHVFGRGGVLILLP